MNDVLLSGSAIALFTVLLSAVASCTVVLFRLLMSIHQEFRSELVSVRERLDKCEEARIVGMAARTAADAKIEFLEFQISEMKKTISWQGPT